MPLKVTSAQKVIITSAFDANLEIQVVNRREALTSNIDIWQWRIAKWYYNIDNHTRELSKFYTLRDLFLIDDLLQEARARLKSMYKYIFVPTHKKYADLNIFEQQRVSQYIWDRDRPETESAEEVETNTPEQFPWEGLMRKKGG